MADLKAAPPSLVAESHKPIQVSSLVVTAESTVAFELELGGYDPGLCAFTESGMLLFQAKNLNVEAGPTTFRLNKVSELCFQGCR